MEAGCFIGKYKLVKKLGAGSFGTIFSAVHVDTQKEFAVKIEYRNKLPQLMTEARMLKQLQHARGIPGIYWTVSEETYNAMIMELLGPSLQVMMNRYHRQIQMTTLLQLASQILDRLEYIHSRGIIHRDIKPDNFCLGLKQNKSIVYAVDFGLSKRYRDQKTHQHIHYRENKSLTGTARFASLNSHLGLELSRRDDMESLSYVLIFMALGELPWQGINTQTKQDKYLRIMEMKQMKPEVLCKALPVEFCSFLKHSRGLRFDDQPDYEYLQSLLRAVGQREAFDVTSELDWTRTVSKRSHSVRNKRHRKRLKNTRILTAQNGNSKGLSVPSAELTEENVARPEITNRVKFVLFSKKASPYRETCNLM